MWVYVGRRLLLAIPTLLGASIVVFAMVHLAPGDPIAAVMPAESSQAEIEATKKGLGFLLWESYQLMQVKQGFVCVLTFGILGVLSTWILQAVERVVCPYR